MDENKLLSLKTETTEIFRYEIHTLVACRGIVRSANLKGVRHEFFEQLNQVNFDLVSMGLKTLVEQDLQHQPGSRAILAWITNYLIILNRLLELMGGDEEGLIEVMWNQYWRVKMNLPFELSMFEEERMLYYFFKIVHKKHYRFCNFHKHAIFQLVLNEYRLRNGWLLGKYDFNWTDTLRDEHAVHQYASHQKKVPTRLGAGIEIRTLHQEHKGQAINGM